MISERILEIFKEITRIPRGSGHEEPMTEYLVKWATEHGLDVKRDEIGNVCITREASAGKENVPTLVLQAHQDMVCEKNEGVTHDFFKDPIEYVVENGWMIAKDTTLGADDGIGIAACLALLESDLPMGKLECVFTISEETGMDGAEAMKEGMKLIFNKFNKTLESLGVTKIETEGKDFDVDFHEAVAMVPGMGDDKKGKVIDCVQTGYQLNDKVIRHAKVAVGQ